MPRSSRSKSHKQSKHSSSRSSDDDVKVKERSSINGGKDSKEDVVVSVRVLKDSGERRKHSSNNNNNNKDLLNVHGNGDVSEKSDRWNGGSNNNNNDGGDDDKGLVFINVEDDKELVKVKDKDYYSKSKSSRRNEDSAASLSVVLEKDESRRGEKRKSEKEFYVRKDGSQYREHKESKEKDKEKDRASSKQLENQSSKKGKEVTEWPIEEELRNRELEKELEKRMRRRGEASSAKDKYQDSAKDKYQDDIKETEDKHLSTRNERSKDERRKNEEYGDIRETRQKDEKHREDGEHDRKSRDAKYRGESGRYSKHKEDKYHEDKYGEDGNKETKYKDDKYMEISDKDERSRDRKRRQDDDDDDRDYKHKEERRSRDSKYRDVPEAKHLRDDNVSTDIRKSNNRDGSPVYDDRVTRYKDDKDRRRGSEKEESNDYRSRSSMKEQRSESEKRLGSKADSEWGRSSSRYADVENAASHSRRRSSPSGSSYPTRDHHRFSKQEETKYRDYAYEDQARHNAHSSRDYDHAPGQSDKKVILKDDGYIGGNLSGEKRPRPESRSSPQIDKSPSSTSNERRNLIKSDARKSLDIEEPGPRGGGSKDTVKDGKGSRDLVNEAHPNNDFAQVDNDNVSVSSPYTRNSHFSGNSKSLLPPPSPSTFRTGSEGPFFGSTEDDRSKSNNRHRNHPNMNRGQSQSQGNWNNIPNWPSPMASGGYIPFQHVPPPMFHPLMPQFPPQFIGRPPMKLNPGLPYHVPDHVRPLTWRNQVDESVTPPLHGWDANNAVFGDESHLYGRLDWDHRTQMSNRGWDQSGEMWKNQNAGGMEVQSGQQKDGYPGNRSNDENWSGLTGQPDEGEQNQPDMQLETLNLDKNGPEALKMTESPQIFEDVKDNNALISQAYLSRVDVSKDLTQPELYDQCTSMMDLDQEALSDEFDCKVLFLEDGADLNVIDSASLFSVTNDSVFQKAMFLYKKQKEQFGLTNTDKEKGGSDDDKSAEEVAAVGVVMENTKEDESPKEPMNIEADGAVVKQVEEHEVAVNESVAPCEVEDAGECTNGGGGGSLVLSDVSSADVAVMPTESVEFGSVNLNRIHHHSPESTH